MDYKCKVGDKVKIIACTRIWHKLEINSIVLVVELRNRGVIVVEGFNKKGVKCTQYIGIEDIRQLNEQEKITLDCIYPGAPYPKKQSWIKRIFKNLKNKKEKTK